MSPPIRLSAVPIAALLLAAAIGAVPGRAAELGTAEMFNLASLAATGTAPEALPWTQYRITLDQPLRGASLSLFIARPVRFAKPPRVTLLMPGIAPAVVAGAVSDDGAQVDYGLPETLPAGSVVIATAFELANLKALTGAIVPFSARLATRDGTLDLPWQPVATRAPPGTVRPVAPGARGGRGAAPPAQGPGVAEVGVPDCGYWWTPELPGAGYGIEIHDGRMKLTAGLPSPGSLRRLHAEGLLDGRRFSAPLMADDGEAGAITVNFADAQTAVATVAMAGERPRTLMVYRLTVAGSVLP